MRNGQRPSVRSMRTAALALVLVLHATGAGAADVVYSWRDPRTGQLTITSVPPPWLRSSLTASSGPPVNVFKDGKVVPPERIGPGGRVLEPPLSKPGEGPQAGSGPKLPALPVLLERRSAAMDELVNEALRVGPSKANEEFFDTLNRYLEFSSQADIVDPVRTAERNDERDRDMQRVKANIERVLRQPESRTAFQNEATRWFSERTDHGSQKVVRCLRDGYC